MDIKEYEKLIEILDSQTKTLVGTLLKRLDELRLPEGQSLSFDQIKLLYSSIVKNSVYESNRNNQKLLKATFETGSIVFTRPTQKE